MVEASPQVGGLWKGWWQGVGGRRVSALALGSPAAAAQTMSYLRAPLPQLRLHRASLGGAPLTQLRRRPGAAARSYLAVTRAGGVATRCRVGDTGADAAVAMQTLRESLQRDWRLGIKEGSGQMVVSDGAPEVQTPPSGTDSEGDFWRVVGWKTYRSMGVLGHQISWDGASMHCWQRISAAAAQVLGRRGHQGRLGP